MMKFGIGAAAATLVLSGCASLGVNRPAGPIKVNPSSIAANPAAYDGREVEVVGLFVWDGGNALNKRSGLYQSYGAYCRDAEKAAISANWANWAGVSQADNRRMAMVRGVFRNRYATSGPNVVISDGAIGPGPLEPAVIVHWLSGPEKPCPRALP